ncbi:MAG TPA: AMP-dependent synthetase/ligase [Solirubrobacteraceae bacterium]|nr:AMP-dependent synthetase/ligase [Solirubrobacteraceae bacterium]
MSVNLNGVSTLCAAFQETRARNPDAVALRDGDGTTVLTWAQVASEVERIAGALAALGVGQGDTVALLLANRPEFNLIDTAAIHLGAVPWSIYATSSPEQIRHLIDGAGSRVAVTEAAFAGRLGEALAGSAVEHVLRIEELPRWPAAPEGFDFDETWRQVSGEDVLTIIWTSGTTGAPKGVELTHDGMLATLAALERVAALKQSPGRAVSYLPAAHVGDRWSAHYWWMRRGLELTCIADPSQMLATLPRVRPTVWGSVPRVFEKLQAALEAQGITDPAALPDSSREQIRARLGLDEAEFLIVGAAPLAVETHDFFTALGLPLCEVWGMSETCGLLTINPPDARRVGTVGPPLPGVELRIASDAEVLARGPMLMRGYRGEPERTAEALAADGWLHTGDIGEFDAAGYVRIVDRKKELIINAAGKNMSPLAIEAALKTAGPLIGQACVIGDRRPYNVALLLLDPDAAHAWSHAHGGNGAPYSELAHDSGLQYDVAAEVQAANERLSRVEQIKRWTLLEHDWVPDGEELTPTMKLKRRAILAKHAAAIEALYE